MGQKEKLIARLGSHPRDFTFAETERLLGISGLSGQTKAQRAARG